MKTTALLSIILLSLAGTSCQSEYERQLTYGKDLVKKEIELRNSGNPFIKLSDIRNDLQKCAHLSGNESLFQSEMVSYKSDLEDRTSINPNRLISKYP